MPKLENSNHGPVPLAMAKVMETLGYTKEKAPRLARALVCAEKESDIKRAIEAVERDPAAPVFIVSVSPEKIGDRLPDLAYLLQFPNVRIGNALNIVTSFGVFSDPREANVGLNPEVAMRRTLGVIRHDLGHALRGSASHNKKKLLEGARTKLGFEGDEESLIKRIMEPGAAVEVNAYRYVPGVFADWDGTLKKDSGFDADAFAHAQEVAREKGLPLVIWTGGDPDNVYRELDALNIDEVNVCGKSDCKGFRVAVAIDDEPLESLNSLFGVDAKEFIRV